MNIQEAKDKITALKERIHDQLELVESLELHVQQEELRTSPALTIHERLHTFTKEKGVYIIPTNCTTQGVCDYINKRLLGPTHSWCAVVGTAKNTIRIVCARCHKL